MVRAKIFLAVVGLVYLALALWCSIDPKTTSEKVGFQLQPGSGQSEFVTGSTADWNSDWQSSF